jgi:glycosyltransferase involved in cell wall biosynthesis
MRILCVIDNLGWGGAQHQMAHLASGLRRRGHDVELFVYHPAFDHVAGIVREAGVRVVAFQDKRRGPDLGVVTALARHLRRQRVDAVIAFLAAPSIYAALAARLVGGVPVVVSERGSFRPERLAPVIRLQRQFYRLAAHVTVNSHHHRERMLREFPWLEGRISTIWNGIDTDRFRPAPSPEAPATPLRLLGVGTVVPIKDIETLARALVELHRSGGPEVFVDWAGQVLESPASKAVVERVGSVLEAEGLGCRWTWLGLRKDVSELHRAADAIVHPSAREGLPNALCEALASGRPVIASRAADHARLVGEGERGFLFEPGDPASLAAAIARLADVGPAGRAALGASARAFAETSLSLSAYVEQYERLLERVTARR